MTGTVFVSTARALFLYVGPIIATRPHAHHAAQVIITSQGLYIEDCVGGCIRTGTTVIPPRMRHGRLDVPAIDRLRAVIELGQRGQRGALGRRIRMRHTLEVGLKDPAHDMHVVERPPDQLGARPRIERLDLAKRGEQPAIGPREVSDERLEIYRRAGSVARRG